MATDSVVEVLVKREKGKKSNLKMIGIWAGAAVIIAGAVALFYMNNSSMMSLALLIAVVTIALAVYLINRLNVEYEYAFFSGDVNIDRIFNQNKRVPYVEFSLRNVEEMGRFDPEKVRGTDGTIICTEGEDGVGGVYLKLPSNVITAGKNVSLTGSHTYVVLENDKRVHEVLKSGLRTLVYREGAKAFN